MNTTNPRATGRSNAYGLRLEYPNDPWSGSVLYREIQADYDAAVGFTPRTGFRRLNPELSYTSRPRGHRLAPIDSVRRQQQPALQHDRQRAAQSRLRSHAGQPRTHSQDFFQVKVLPTYERLENNFAISPGITLPVGSEYSWTRYRFAAATAPRRVVALNPIYEFGGFYNGTRLRVATDLNVRVRPGVIIYTSAEWNRVELEEGRFETRLFRDRARAAVQPMGLMGEQHPVRHAERGARLAVALPLDRQARQRSLFRLHPQLGGRPAGEPLLHARSAGGQQSALHAPVLSAVIRMPFHVDGPAFSVALVRIALALYLLSAGLAMAGVPMPSRLSNPVIQFAGGILLLLGLWTRLTAAVVGVFLVTIFFGHLLADPFDRGASVHAYAMANFLAAVAILWLQPRGNRLSIDALVSGRSRAITPPPP